MPADAPAGVKVRRRRRPPVDFRGFDQLNKGDKEDDATRITKRKRLIDGWIRLGMP
jgi:hypothetical protein